MRSTLLGGLLAVLAFPTHALELISRKPDGTPFDYAYQSFVSQTGRYVVFLQMHFLPPFEAGCGYQWYLRDTVTDTTELVSRTPQGAPASCIASFTERYWPTRADVSADGRYVVFDFAATDIVGDVPPPRLRVYRLDRSTGTTALVGDIATPAMNPTSDHSGRFVLAAVLGTSRRLVRFDMQTGAQADPAGASDWVASQTAISGDGNRVAYVRRPTQTEPGQLFVADIAAQTTQLASAVGGQPADTTPRRPALDFDGSVVVFESSSPALTGSPIAQIVRRDLDSDAPTVVSRGLDGQPAAWIADFPSISDDGLRVAFRTGAQNFPRIAEAGYSQVYAVDVRNPMPLIVSVSDVGEVADRGALYEPCEDAPAPTMPCAPLNPIYSPQISGDGRFVGFYSFSTNLAADDPHDDGGDVYFAPVPWGQLPPLPVPALNALGVLALATLSIIAAGFSRVGRRWKERSAPRRA